MSIPRIFYNIVNELYDVLRILYSNPSQRVCSEVALASLLLLVFSALYGGATSKIVVMLVSLAILIFISSIELRELIHIYADLMIFVLLITLPAIVVTYATLGDIASLSLPLLSTVLSVISVSTVALAMIAALGVREIVEAIQRISKTFATVFMLTLTVIPKIVLHIATLTLARASRTIKPCRLYILGILISSLGDAILLSSNISYQTLLAIKSRSIAERRRRRCRARAKALNYILLPLSTSIAIAVYLGWI